MTESRAQRCAEEIARQGEYGVHYVNTGVTTAIISRHFPDYAELEAENERLRGAIETLVVDEVISAGRARELHGMSPEEQRKFWVDRYEQSVRDAKAIQDPDRAMEEAEDRKMRERDFAPPEEEPSE